MTKPLTVDPRFLPYATDREREFIAALEAHGSASAAARALGVDKAGVCRALSVALPARARAAMRKAALEPKGTDGFIARELTTAYDADGNVSGEWLREGPEPELDYGGEPAGPARDGDDPYFIHGVSTYYDASGAVRGQWVKTSLDRERRDQLLRAMLDGAADELPRAEPAPAPADCDDDLLTLYPFGDPHAGLYAWAEETGQGFDLREFERLSLLAADRAVESAPPSATAIFNDKGDTTHADNSKNRTPRSGHELDVHGRHAEVMRVVVKVKRYQIARMLEKHRKVIVRVDPGNHDPESALHLALILEALYENEPRVEVITTPNKYWYYLFGSVLIGTCHGDGAKGKDLPLLMATDQPKWWGASEFRTWIVGHVHHKDIKEYSGCDVEFVRTLAPSDAWAHGAGYRPKRDLQAITYHRLDGEIERHTSSLKRIQRLAA